MYIDYLSFTRVHRLSVIYKCTHCYLQVHLPCYLHVRTDCHLHVHIECHLHVHTECHLHVYIEWLSFTCVYRLSVIYTYTQTICPVHVRIDCHLNVHVDCLQFTTCTPTVRHLHVYINYRLI